VEEMKISYVNVRRFQKCPHVNMHVGGYHTIAVVDSGHDIAPGIVQQASN
jgi:hypothetical protein